MEDKLYYMYPIKDDRSFYPSYRFGNLAPMQAHCLTAPTRKSTYINQFNSLIITVF